MLKRSHSDSSAEGARIEQGLPVTYSQMVREREENSKCIKYYEIQQYFSFLSIQHGYKLQDNMKTKISDPGETYF